MAVLSSASPATGEVLARIEEHSEVEVERRLARAQEVFRVWRRRPVAERAALVARAADVLSTGKARLDGSRRGGKTLRSAVASALR